LYDWHGWTNPMRLGGIFIALCMLIIAGSAGAIAYLYFELGLAQAGAAAAATLIVLILYSLISGRIGFRSVVDRQLTDLARGSADIARQVAEMGRRLAALEGKVDSALDQTRALTDPLTAEIGELGTLVKRLAETVAIQQTGLEALQRNAASPADARAIATTEQSPPLPQPGAVQEHSSRNVETVLPAIRHAIDANEIDLYLQPVVSLPQRKVRHYESMSRLRDEKGEPLPAADFITQAESAGLMPQIDNLVLFRCVAIVRRLLLKNHEIGLFCNLSRTTLADASYFSRALDFLAANRVIAPSLVLQFTHAAVRAMGPIEYENLAALFDHGFRFSMDQVLDLRIEPADLAKRGFRFVKIHSSLLLRGARSATETRPSELADLLGRFGIDLIADRIETENTVVDLLDLDVRYGQGVLFSPPRPVRAEVLQGIPERPPELTRERGGADCDAASDHSLPDAPAAIPQERNAELTALTELASGATGHN
jgi:cyclic-di-GMP phosphodiesterase TipF (flagellum assembly factor)